MFDTKVAPNGAAFFYLKKEFMMSRNVVVGICGIGHGHCLRQTPIIQTLLKRGDNVAVFAFGNSVTYVQHHFPDVQCYEVAVPWICGGLSGVDFMKTADKASLMPASAYERNWNVMAHCQSYFGGKIDLVISDYEPVSAQFAYALCTKLVTLDQQSKYLGFEHQNIKGYSHLEERARLNMFFPKAHKRVACSFFDVNTPRHEDTPVHIIPPFVRPAVKALQPNQSPSKRIIVYLSSYSDFVQPIADVCSILSTFENVHFDVFSGNACIYGFKTDKPNITMHGFEEDVFLSALASASAAITTGGHNFLSELMFLGIPAYVVPLGNYEQHMNAKVIGDNMFGICAESLTVEHLAQFIKNTETYRDTIASDKNVLLKSISNDAVDLLVQSFFD